MGNKKRIIIAVVAVVAIIGGAVLYTVFAANNTSAPEATSEQPAPTDNTNDNTDDAAVASVITYNGSSFSLSASTVKSESKVKIVNDSSNELEVGSGPHPVHTDNPELNTGEIAPGESKTIMLTTKGTWSFHNHLASSHSGSITVE